MGFHLIDPNYQSALDLMTVRPVQAVMEYQNRFVRKCREMGILAAADGLYAFGADSQASCINLANPGFFTCAIVGGLTWHAHGVTGNGTTGSLNTTFVPSTAGGHWVLDSPCMFLWSLTSAASAGTTQFDMGATSADLRCRTSTDLIAASIDDGTTQTAANTDGADFYVTARRAASGTGAKVIRKNLAQVATATTASVALPTTAIHVLRKNGAGLSSRQIMFAGFGANMSDDQFNALYWIGREYGFACGALT